MTVQWQKPFFLNSDRTEQSRRILTTTCIRYERDGGQVSAADSVVGLTVLLVLVGVVLF